jgi:release factor glutamine methyltransferase
MTLREALQQAIPRLEAAGVDSPRLDAELLLTHVLERSRTYLAAYPAQELTSEDAARFKELVARRERREPLPYLLGYWEWLGMRFRVTPAVLIPRPETETLVEETASRLPRDTRILDIGAGSGCISIGLAKLLPGAQVTALELSPEAAAVARENVEALVPGRVTLIEGGFPEAARNLGPFEALVSNPPYIPTEEVEGLPPELRLHEPRLALDGGADGLRVVRSLVQDGARLVVAGGLLALELALGQADRVGELVLASGLWEALEIRRDLAGVERVLFARRKP